MKKLKKYCVIACTVFSVFVSSLIVTKAAGTQATLHTLYKTNTLGNAYEYVVISVEFADYTSGTIVIEVGNLSFYDYMVFGARLSNIYSNGNTRRLTLQVDDCKQVCIYCLPHAGSMISLSPSIYSNNTSYVEHVNQSFIETQFATTNGYIDDLESTCNSIYTDVHNIYLQLIDQALDLDNIQSQLTSIGNYLYTTNSTLSTINSTLTLLLAKINQLNSDLDSISWSDWTGSYDLGGTSNPSTWNVISSNGANGYQYTGVRFNNSLSDRGNDILWIRMPILKSGNGDNSIYLINHNNNVVNFSDYCYYVFGRYFIDIYIYRPYPWNGNVNKIVINGSTYEYYTFGTSVKYITSSNQNYWSLISYFDNIKNSKAILNSLNELSTDEVVTAINSLPMARIVELLETIADNTDQTVTDNINNYNFNMDIINDIESDISVDFGTYDNTFQNNEAGKWQFDSQLQSPVNALQGVFTSVVGFVPVAGTWLSILLLCAVIIALLG